MSMEEMNSADTVHVHLATKVGNAIGDIFCVVLLAALAFGCSGFWHQ
jgi:hypothetical protein